METWEWNNKGVSLMNQGKCDEALACFDKSLAIDSRNDAAWNNKSNTLRLLCRREEAMQCLDRALKLNPSNPRAWCNKGALLSQLKQPDAALKCFYRALEIEPVDSELIGIIWAAANECQPSMVEAVCRRITSLNIKPNDFDGFFNLAICYLQLNEFENALTLLLEAERVRPDNACVWFELMNIYFKQQNAPKVIHYADKLIGSSNHTDAVDKKARALFYNGDLYGALSLLTSTLKSYPQFALLWYTLSDIYAQAGYYTQSLAAIRDCYNVAKSHGSGNLQHISRRMEQLATIVSSRSDGAGEMNYPKGGKTRPEASHIFKPGYSLDIEGQPQPVSESQRSLIGTLLRSPAGALLAIAGMTLLGIGLSYLCLRYLGGLVEICSELVRQTEQAPPGDPFTLTDYDTRALKTVGAAIGALLMSALCGMGAFYMFTEVVLSVHKHAQLPRKDRQLPWAWKFCWEVLQIVLGLGCACIAVVLAIPTLHYFVRREWLKGFGLLIVVLVLVRLAQGLIGIPSDSAKP